MPIYEYMCTECGAETEEIQKFSDSPLQKCESCGGKLEKKLSLSGFHLKGSGWYADGYSKDKSKKPATKDSSKPDTKKKSSDKGSSKPDTAKKKPASKDA